METQVKLGTLALCLFGLVILAHCSKGHTQGLFQIEAGEAGYTLNEWARQSDRQILFDYLEISTVITSGVYGEMDPYEALGRMVQDTGYVFDVVNERTAVVVKGDKPYCQPELGAAAPLPPCRRRVLTIRIQRK